MGNITENGKGADGTLSSTNSDALPLNKCVLIEAFVLCFDRQSQ